MPGGVTPPGKTSVPKNYFAWATNFFTASIVYSV